MNMHLISFNVAAAEAALGWHDTHKFLELKHFLNKNSGMVSKIKRQWEFTPAEEEQLAIGRHERTWAEIDTVHEAVEGVLNLVCLEHQVRNYSYSMLAILRACHQVRCYQRDEGDC